MAHPEEAYHSVFADFAGGPRQPTIAEAQAETGETGRRKVKERDR